MPERRKRLLSVGGVLGAGAMWLSMTAYATAAGAAPATLYVAPTGSGGGSCASPNYNTISAAVAAASAGDTIDVCNGTYKEAVDVTKQLTLQADPATSARPVVDGTGLAPFPGAAITVEGPSAAGTVVNGLSVQHAPREGIVVEGTSGVTISNNAVTNNDLSCIPQNGPDDCGEGIHLIAVTGSTVSNNLSEHNSGGILMEDGIPPGSIGAQAFGFTTKYYGPSDGNKILNNVVKFNSWDCGITMPSHNSNAVDHSGQPSPSTGGVFSNLVQGNTSDDNGTLGGGGSGILMAAPFPGTASYNNTINANEVSGNGQSGITIHSHAPGQDVNGNVITNNTVGSNAVGETQPGQGVFTQGTSQGDSDFGDPMSTGILVGSAVVPVTGTVLTGNHISNNHYGIWLANVIPASLANNTFTNVKVPVFIRPAPGSGYLLGAADGGVFQYGGALYEGSAHGLTSGYKVVGMAQTPDGGGYWMVASNGGVFSFGDAAFYGSLGNVKLAKPIVGIAATPDGHGYWLVASDGGVFSFGNATFHGSLGNVKLAKPIVGVASTSDGGGYWLVASDGGIFSFGDATFHGSLGNVKLNKPVVGMAGTSDDGGYWLVASDGGVFSFGDAHFMGSTGNVKLVQPIVGMMSAPMDSGYWLVASDGGVFSFGHATFHGSAGNIKLDQPVVGGVAP